MKAGARLALAKVLRDHFEGGLADRPELVADAADRTGIPHLEDATEDEIDDVAISSIGGGSVMRSTPASADGSSRINFGSDVPRDGRHDAGMQSVPSWPCFL